MRKFAFPIFLPALVLPLHIDANETCCCAKWMLMEISFKLKKVNDRPLELEFGTRFIHSDGSRMQEPGAHKDKNSWINFKKSQALKNQPAIAILERIH